MKSFFTRSATQWITGLFLVSAISGVALFFRWAPGAFHAMHVWLSMLLLLPFFLHLWKNWGAFCTYIQRKTLWIPLALSLVIALPFAWQATQGGESAGGNPAFRIIGVMTKASLSELAPLFHSTPDALVAKLQGQGFSVSSADEAVSQIASDSGKEGLAVLQVLASSR